MQQGLTLPSHRLTLGAFLEQWLADVVFQRNRPSTALSYEFYTRKYIIPRLGRHQVTKLTPRQVQRFLNEQHAAGLAPRTVQYIRAILRRALNQALRWELVSRNVATLADPPSGRGPEMSPLSTEHARAFLAAARDHRHEYLFAFLLGTGLRIGEALALRWSDVNLDDSVITVRHALERLRGHPWRLSVPKSESGKRLVPLVGPTSDARRAQRTRTLELRLTAGPAWRDLDFVFPTVIGTPEDQSNVYHQSEKLLAQADLPTTYRVHDLRHSTATYLLAAGVPDRLVMGIMGHSQLSMTMRYQHVLPSMLKEAAARLEAVFPAERTS
ncbi:MAG: site-specific integrase [Chloroflexi bacterium]|nr:site-specific integrase [Chloroflexota bacterium]